MISANNIFHNCINSPVRHIKGRVELYEGSTLLNTFNATDNLKSFTIERTGEENKFFGFGICQKLTAKIMDMNRTLSVKHGQTLEAVLGTQCHYIYPYPSFSIKEIKRDELTNELTLVGYDKLYDATAIRVSSLGLKGGYTIEMFAAACAAALGLPLNLSNLPSGFNTYYPYGANFEGTESVRAALDAIAEATQTIYYIDHDWNLTFKRLSPSAEPVFTIDKSRYVSMKSGDKVTLTKVCHATELGDNVIAGAEGGRTQFVRNNPFWDLREDIATLVNTAAANVSNLSINQFTCSWRGNYLLEIGDKINLVTKDNEIITTFLLDDKLTYNGGMSEETQWTYTEADSETAANPTTIGEALNQTYARVDKANKRIELVASEVNNTNENISQLIIDTQKISATVTSVEETVTESISGLNEEIATLTKSVEAAITAEDVTIAINQAISNGVDTVKTTTGFTFNEEGLTVSKTGREMTTTITEDGMTVYKDNTAVLTANNKGVNARDLKAENYLIIGDNSRFEDYNGNRTGCFWIGGV